MQKNAITSFFNKKNSNISAFFIILCY